MKTTRVQAHLKEGASPYYIRARPVPLILRWKVKEEHLDMVARGTLSRLESAELVSPIVSILKVDGKVQCYGRRKPNWVPGTLVKQLGATLWYVKIITGEDTLINSALEGRFD
ncbi:unnamed protein product [Lepeophtheirus salmonis]|uniref:(salmon louse) hypothetical protein n=1 Tax=Lepeophtheirus salmonis TaxID=72036 RepID=A0A817FEI3_LEPSM|nr:unnamed protein product [Lepeophtheirus salmonis]